MFSGSPEGSLTWRVMPDMLSVIDGNGCFRGVNPAWEKTLGWTSAEMTGQPFIDFVHHDDIERTMVAFRELLTGEPVLRFENRYRCKQGEFRWMSWVCVPEEGDFYCTARDVTDDKLHVETIARQDVEAQLREQFLAILGHDLRNPLAAFESGLRILLRKTKDEQLNSVIAQMQSSTRRMSELIENMMDLARARQGDGIEVELSVDPRMAEEIEQVAQEIRLANPTCDIVMNANIAEEVRCDLPRIKQVVSNLLANAVKHGRDAGAVVLSVTAENGRFILSVRNYGEPIPEEIKQKLFQPFFRGEEGAAQHGLGLGLYISAQIATAHGGTLVASSDDMETCFTLDIPSR